MLPKTWACWEITKCQGSENCPARLNDSKPCWEIARELDDYRNAMNVCGDCIVYVTKQDDSILGPEEIISILAEKGACTLMAHCPNSSASPDSER